MTPYAKHAAGDEEGGGGRRSRRKKSRRRQSVWGKLALLLWKNVLLRRRHWLLTLLEVVLPSLLFTLLLTVRVLPDTAFVPTYINETTTFSVGTEMTLKEAVCHKYGMWLNPPMVGGVCFVPPSDSPLIQVPGQRKVFYGPPGNFTRDVAERVAFVLRLPKNVLEPVDSNEDLDLKVNQAYYQGNDSWASFFVGLFFHDLEDPNPEPPQHLVYDLRLQGVWLTTLVYPFIQIPGPRNFSLLGESGASYNMDGFTLIQSVVDRYYIAQLTGDTSYMRDYELQTQMYPYPPYLQDNAMSQFYGASLPTFIVFSLVLLSPSLIKSVVYEKATGVRELVRLMGLESWLVWLGWFLHSFTVVVVVASLMTLLLKLEVTPLDDGSGGYLPPILAFTDASYIWVLLLLYGISSITFCFFISTFFSKPTLATTIGVLVWLVSYLVPRSIMDDDYQDMSLAPKLASCLLPNMAMTWAFRIISMFEGRGVGVHWDKVWETGNPRDQLTPAAVLLMLAFDTLLFMALTWYLDQVNPGTFGVPKPFYFPLQRSYWCGVKDEEEQEVKPQVELDRDCFEEEPVGLIPGIVTRNLRKEFKALCGQTKVAVEDVSFTCYEGQCTVLLGHNGAGKTTTMSILTGVYAASGGQAQVGGWNVASQLEEARTELGLCPQHNMLFVDLTVLQHLLFFGRLKGLTKSKARQEAHVWMTRLDLLEKKNMFGNQLSGGMKRKLCLAIALIGGSKVVILDEPSSGLDPESRRWVWEVVQGERGRRTVLVTTHHMEEADVLGDRVAIMAAGRVVAAGSTLFLKNKFGDGYTLTAMVAEGSSVEALSQAISAHLPQATLRAAQSGEVTFRLPPETSKFAALFDSLTARRGELGLHHLGLSLTSMEQVFLRVGEEKSTETETLLIKSAHDVSSSPVAQEKYTSLNRPDNEESPDAQMFSSQLGLVDDKEERVTGIVLLRQRIRAFFIKRFIYTKRKWVLLLSQGLLPVLVTLTCLLMDALLLDQEFQEPPVNMTLDIYPSSISFVQADPPFHDLSLAYQSLFTSPHLVNTTNDMQTSLLHEAEEHLEIYRENNVCSAMFLENGTVAAMRMMYQSVPYHTPGVGTSLVTNALLRLATNSSENSITTINRPLPQDTTWKIQNDNSSGSALMYSTLMPLALSFLCASFLVFPLQERETKAKQVQVMTGAPLWVLWTTSYLWDALTYLATVLLIFICFMIFDSKGYFTAQQAAGALFLLLLLYGWASIPMAYVFSFPFQTAASGFAVVTLINIVAGMIMTLAVWALDLADNPKLTTASTVLNWISSVVPTYAASRGFLHLVDTSVYNVQCDQFNASVKADLCDTLANVQPRSPFMFCCPQCSQVPNMTCFEKRGYFVFDEPGMSADLLTLFVNGVFFLGLLLLAEARVGRLLSWVWWRVKAGCSTAVILETPAVQDEDVVAQTAHVEALLSEREQGVQVGRDDSTLLVHGLTKRYRGCPLPAVNNISFRVGRGECLGLLGVNGAGKTTTFKMLTGDENPSAGDARIGNVSLSDGSKFVQSIGYCPQFDAVLGELTGVETLTLVARLRGVRPDCIRPIVSTLVSLVGLTECALRPSSTYSGGNRRKLSTAMALVGAPPLVFLDEPTSGVDPASRRRVWTAVSQAVNNGQSVVLTSHSMEECEALCSRIIIMSRGSLRCVGTPTHLKAKFGQGYSLQLKLKTFSLGPNGEEEGEESYQARVTHITESVRAHLPGVILTDQHRGMMAFRVPPAVSWGRLFSVMEALKVGGQPREELEGGAAAAVTSWSLLEDYAVSDTSLEQVFLSFAREVVTTPLATADVKTIL